MATDSNAAAANRQADPYQLDRRLTILETRFDTILPTLATKADLADLMAEIKDDLRTGLAGVCRWVATLFVTMVIGFVGMILTMLNVLRH